MRPRGRPPTPSAMSRAIEPEGMVSTAIRALSSPSFMIAPLPNCFSICCKASSSALPFSLADGVLFPIILRLLRRGERGGEERRGGRIVHEPPTAPARLPPEAWSLGRREPSAQTTQMCTAAPAPISAGERSLVAHAVDRAPGRERALDHDDAIHLEARVGDGRRGAGERLRPVALALADAADRQVRLERPVGAAEARVLERALDRARQLHQPVAALREAEPQPARLARRGERAGRPERGAEGGDAAGRRPHRRRGAASAGLAEVAEEAEGEMQVVGLHPRHAVALGPQRLDHRGRAALDRRRREHGDEDAHQAALAALRASHQSRLGSSGNPWSWRRTRSSAVWALRSRTVARLPANRKVLTASPRGEATAMNTVPTGFSVVPPSGPAIPVMPTP